MPKTIFNVIQRSGILTAELMLARGKAAKMGKIPEDVLNRLTPAQEICIVRERHTVCLDFQKQLEVFWKKHYNAATWKMTKSYLDAPDDMKPDMDKCENGAYRALTRADFNVSHEGNRDLDHLNRFLKRFDRKELQTEDMVKWVMAAASSMPSTFVSAYDLYTGRTDIDVRPFFPEMDFTGVDLSRLKPESTTISVEGKV